MKSVMNNETRMQEMESRVNIPAHGQSSRDFLPDVMRGWLVAKIRTLRVQQEDRGWKH